MVWVGSTDVGGCFVAARVYLRRRQGVEWIAFLVGALTSSFVSNLHCKRFARQQEVAAVGAVARKLNVLVGRFLFASV